jgi:F-type H+-transporting ATPase subunit gamma
VDAILEPDAATIFDTILPRYVGATLFNAFLESLTSEYASRRVSMKNATDAAKDMQSVLRGQYNQLRQESITKELLDIVGGVEALR